MRKTRRLLRRLAGIENLGFQQELVGLLEEELLGRLVAEAIGAAGIDRVDRAIGLDLLAEREPHYAVIVELALRGGGGRQAKAQADKCRYCG
jgi:hypothetical protein